MAVGNREIGRKLEEFGNVWRKEGFERKKDTIKPIKGEFPALLDFL